jgi:hypothetical protein
VREGWQKVEEGLEVWKVGGGGGGDVRSKLS